MKKSMGIKGMGSTGLIVAFILALVILGGGAKIIKDFAWEPGKKFIDSVGFDEDDFTKKTDKIDIPDRINPETIVPESEVYITWPDHEPDHMYHVDRIGSKKPFETWLEKKETGQGWSGSIGFPCGWFEEGELHPPEEKKKQSGCAPSFFNEELVVILNDPRVYGTIPLGDKNIVRVGKYAYGDWLKDKGYENYPWFLDGDGDTLMKDINVDIPMTSEEVEQEIAKYLMVLEWEGKKTIIR